MKYPLNIYVVWHPNNAYGIDYARAIFSAYSRDVQQPLERGIGIPTYFISNADDIVSQVDSTSAKQTCVIVLIDDHMILDEHHDGWETEINRVYAHALQNKSDTFFFPVALSENVNNFSSKLNTSNRLNLYEIHEANQQTELLLQIAFKLSTRLYHFADPANELLETDNKKEFPIKVFISHARQDGQTLAHKFKDIIDKLTMRLESYIDVRDIGKGAQLEPEIKQAINKSIFLVLKTDIYGSREWCIKEVLQAKSLHCPIIVVDATRKNIKRTFPYLGNAPSIRLRETPTGGYNIEEIVKHILLETLRYKYHEQLNQILLEDAGDNIYTSLALPPELLTIVEEKDKNFLYPDPPLGNMELDVLKKTRPDIKFMTPTLWASQHQQQDTFLKDKIIGFSISENIHLAKEGAYHLFDNVHLQDVLVEISRYLLACGGRPSYGGRIDYLSSLNFTTVLTDLVTTYVKEYQEGSMPVVNHVCYPFSDNIRKNIPLRTKYKGMIDFKLYKNPFKIPFDDYRSKEGTIALTDMRRKMAEFNDVQILLGGKVEGYSGLMPGLLEEAYWMLNNDKPIFIIGAFGGMSAELVMLLMEGKSQLLETEMLKNTQDKNWQERYTFYSTCAQRLWKEEFLEVEQRLHYNTISTYFHTYWTEHGNNLPNGLSKAQNIQLFYSKNVLEITQLILEGLNNLFKKKEEK